MFGQNVTEKKVSGWNVVFQENNRISQGSYVVIFSPVLYSLLLFIPIHDLVYFIERECVRTELPLCFKEACSIFLNRYRSLQFPVGSAEACSFAVSQQM